MKTAKPDACRSHGFCHCLKNSFKSILRSSWRFSSATVGCNEDLGSLTWGFSTYTSSDNFVFDAGGAQWLHLRAYDQCLVLHLFAESCRPWTPDGDWSVSSWTKDEIENLIDGYPPFYSAEVHLKGMTTESPIHSVDDIRKGGCVLAGARLGPVGLSPRVTSPGRHSGGSRQIPRNLF
jgi:hypothetical protein